MKRLLPIIWVFGIPFLVMEWNFVGHFQISYLWLFALNVILLATPQIVWALICFLPLPRSAYIGGLIGANALLLFTELWYLFVITKDDPYNEGFAFAIGFFYLPFSLAAVPIGALLGFLINVFIRAIPTW